MPVRLCRTSQAVNRVVSLRLEVSRAEHCPNDPSSQSVAVSAEHRSTKKPSMHGKHILAPSLPTDIARAGEPPIRL